MGTCTTYMMRCKSCNAWGCKKKVKIVVHNGPQPRVALYDAAGWDHTHSGEFKLQRGLPPQLKVDLTAILAREPQTRPKCAPH